LSDRQKLFDLNRAVEGNTEGLRSDQGLIRVVQVELRVIALSIVLGPGDRCHSRADQWKKAML
jgi:hypothetical protein